MMTEWTEITVVAVAVIATPTVVITSISVGERT